MDNASPSFPTAMETLSGRLRACLHRRDETLQELVERTGLGYGTVQGIVAGTRRNPSRATLERLADHFRVSVDWLLNGQTATAAPVEGPPWMARLHAFLDRESEAALERARGFRELAVAARIAEEEGRERRLAVSGVRRIEELARQGEAAVDAVLGPPAPAPPARTSGPGPKDGPQDGGTAPASR